MKSRILSASTITGQNVYNLNDENIGDIKDLMIDPSNAEVLYAVLAFGGFMGIGSKLFAIPLEALQFSDKNDTIRLDVTKEKLENAPSFDEDNWPMTADNDFVDSVYSHYGYQDRQHTLAE
ncbi:MAG: PRC-barrel domain-containing protein [Balneolaceae bacterium]